MNSVEVKAALATRWPDDQYIRIEEAPQDASRQGRKIDVLVVSLWASRGYELDAVEVKVSMSDWRRELDNAAKADWWWRHTHRFWIAVPTGIADKVRADLPDTWGLLACGSGGTKTVVKAPKHAAEPLPWPSCIGIIRASADAGVAALYRAREQGRADGFKEGQQHAQTESSPARIQSQLDSLREKVDAFEAASGVDISAGWRGAEIGRAVGAVRSWSANPEWRLAELERLGDQAKRAGKDLVDLAAEVRASFAPPAVEAVS